MLQELHEAILSQTPNGENLLLPTHSHASREVTDRIRTEIIVRVVMNMHKRLVVRRYVFERRLVRHIHHGDVLHLPRTALGLYAARLERVERKAKESLQVNVQDDEHATLGENRSEPCFDDAIIADVGVLIEIRDVVGHRDDLPLLEVFSLVR